MKYISLLRGINVSGHKNIKMLDLKSIYESLDLNNVITYIQSGNVIFDSRETIISNIRLLIEQAIEKKYSFYVPVDIRTRREFEKIISECPFGPVNLDEDGTRLLVTFLSAIPNKHRISQLQDYVSATEKLVVTGRQVYLYCPKGYGKSKLSNAFLEKKLGVTATTRNWKSLLQLQALSK